MLMTKFVGKPYAGKLHVRFDEGAGKVFCLPRSTLLVKITTKDAEVFTEKATEKSFDVPLGTFRAGSKIELPPLRS